MSAYRFGQSAWSLTAKINAVDKHGDPTAFFLKVRYALFHSSPWSL